MPNQITANGLETKTLSTIVSELTGYFQAIYGSGINTDPNSPDGQLIHIIAQMVKDELDLCTQVYTSMDPDQAIGRTLDVRCSINGIKRQPATYSTTDINVTAAFSLNLQGLDGNESPIGGEFIVADNAGVQWVLINSTSINGGDTLLAFRAVEAGAILTTPNTITVPVTIILGVTAVNNPSGQLTIGQNEETDAQLRIRRQRSVALSSSGFYSSLVAALLDLSGVTTANVYENITGTTDSDGIPGHSIWVVVGGTAANADIAQTIYAKRNAGCGMKGAITVVITRPNGSPFTIQWDVVETEDLYVEFNLDALSGDYTSSAHTHTSTTLDNLDAAVVAKLQVGMLVRGTGIPATTTIATIPTSTSVTLSLAATSTGTITATFVPLIVDDLKTALADALVLTVNEQVNINQIATVIQSVNPNALITVAGVSTDGMTYYNSISPTAKNKQFSLIVDNITVS